MPRAHNELAEGIINTEGLIFALAIKNGKEEDMRKARQYLKAAIVRALDEAANR